MKNLTASGRAGAFLPVPIPSFAQDQQQIVIGSQSESEVTEVTTQLLSNSYSRSNLIGGKCAMTRPMNEWENDLGVLCDALPACGEVATHCDSEATDYPLFLCTAHAAEHVLIHGGTVKTEPKGHTHAKKH